MRIIICILMCLSMTSMVSALSTTNGDFEALGIREDVPDWFEESGTYLRLKYSPTGTQYMGFEDDDCWAYQSIGFNTGGLAAIQVQYDIGSVTNAAEPLDLVINISLYESDGSFVGADGRRLNGSSTTLIDSVNVSYPAMAPGQVVTDSVTLHYLNFAGSGELFLRLANAGDDDDDTNNRFAIDNVQIVDTQASIVSRFPKDGTESVAADLASTENDLVFTVIDDDVTLVDVLFGPDNDPNLSSYPQYKIVSGMSVSSGNQYAITLDTELAEDLEWETEYSWKVLAYEPNGLGFSLKYTSPVLSFSTIQNGPYLGDVTPEILRAFPGEDPEFTLPDASKADTFQWYKKGDPDVALSNGADYAGVDTDTLTILDAQLDDEGFYYCVGTETATTLTAQTLTDGELRLKLLKTHYPFEQTYTVGSNIYTPDIISGKDMQLIGGADLDDANSIIGHNLLLENPLGATTEYGKIADNTVAHYEDITISFWANPTTMINQNDRDRWSRVFDFGSSATNYIMMTMLYRQDDARQGGKDVARCELRYFDDEGAAQNPELDVESNEIAAGKWYYVAITIENGRGRIYLSGQHGTEGERPQILNIPSLTEIVKTVHYVGKGIAFNPSNFNGRIDEFKIFNYAQTSEEVAAEYFDTVEDDTICDTENYDLYDWDYNENCIIDLPDFAEIAAKWLDSYLIYQD